MPEPMDGPVGPPPADLFPRFVRPAVFRRLWTVLVVLLVVAAVFGWAYVRAKGR